jgi:acetoacetate decarboxylase
MLYFAMPLASPAFPMGPYHFVDRAFLTIAYRTDPEKLRAMVPEPLVHYEFIRMRDATGFGDYTESRQVIPVMYQGRRGSYRRASENPYRLVEPAKGNHIESYRYLLWLFKKIPLATTTADYAALLDWSVPANLR